MTESTGQTRRGAGRTGRPEARRGNCSPTMKSPQVTRQPAVLPHFRAEQAHQALPPDSRRRLLVAALFGRPLLFAEHPQDVRIIDLVLESGRALVLAFNKWDELEDERRRYLEREIEQDLAHVDWAPRVNISAKTGRHLEKLVPALEVALDSWDQRIPTGKLNAFIQELTMETPHPVRGGKQPRILFATQAGSRPPKFVLFTTGFLDPGYRRFIQRRLRETYGFEGTPIEVGMRVREKRKRT